MYTGVSRLGAKSDTLFMGLVTLEPSVERLTMKKYPFRHTSKAFGTG
jgi:hypothetical protein